MVVAVLAASWRSAIAGSCRRGDAAHVKRRCRPELDRQAGRRAICHCLDATCRTATLDKMSNVIAAPQRIHWPATPCSSQQSRPCPVSRSWRCCLCCRCRCWPAATTVVLKPAGDIAAQQRDLIVISTVADAADHRPGDGADACCSPGATAQSNTEATYEPDWDHSTQLELVIWAAPLLIIICARRADLDRAPTCSIPTARSTASTPSAPVAGRRQAAAWSRSSRSTGSGCSSIPSRASPPSTSWPRRSTVPIQFHITVVDGDELVLRPGAGRPDLRDAGHGDASCTRSSTSRRRTRASRPTTAAPASPTCASSFHGLTDADFDALGRAGQGRRRRARPRRLPAAGEAERERAGAPLRARVDADLFDADPQPLRRDRQDVHERDDGDRRQGRRSARPAARARCYDSTLAAAGAARAAPSSPAPARRRAIRTATTPPTRRRRGLSTRRSVAPMRIGRPRLTNADVQRSDLDCKLIFGRLTLGSAPAPRADPARRPSPWSRSAASSCSAR